MRTAKKYINIYVPGPKNCFFGSWSTHFEWREVFCFLGILKPVGFDDHPWELINPIRNQPWGICSTISKKVPKKTNRSPCYFTRTTSPIFHAHTTHAWLTTSDGTCLVWLIINAVRKLKCFFISVRLPRICLGPFQCRNAIRRFVPSKSHLTSPHVESPAAGALQHGVGCSYPSMAGRSNSWGPSMIITPKRNCP